MFEDIWFAVAEKTDTFIVWIMTKPKHRLDFLNKNQGNLFWHNFNIRR